MFVKDPTMNPHFPPVADISNCRVYGIWQDDRAITAQLRPQVMQPMLPVPREEALPRVFDGTSGATSCDQRLPTGGCISKSLVVYACLS